MAKDFYTEWLGIPPGGRPPDHYTLLGVPQFCKDTDAIENATRARLTRLDEYAMHPDRATRDAVQDMMNAVARARVVLVHSRRGKAYDEGLARKLGVIVPGAPETRQPPAPRPIVTDTTVSRVERPTQRRRPAAPVAPQPEPWPPVPVAEPLSPEESVREFERVVWAHLRRWRVNAHEERLLVAEAATFGIDAEKAMHIVHRIEREAETRARREGRRTTWIVVGLALAAATVLFVVLVRPQLARSRRQRLFETSMLNARQCVRVEDLLGALKHLDEAEERCPGDGEVQVIRERVAAKGEELKKRAQALLSKAQGAMSHYDLQNAEGAIAQARKALSKTLHEDTKLSVRLGQLEKELNQKLRFQQRLSEASEALTKWNLELAERKLHEAEPLCPNHPHPAALLAALQAQKRVAEEQADLIRRAESILAGLPASPHRLTGPQRILIVDAIRDLSNLTRLKFSHKAASTLVLKLSRYVQRSLDLGQGVTIKLVLIPAGRFIMGAAEDDRSAVSSMKPQRQVTISKAFYMSATEVTQAQWKAAMGTEPWKGRGLVKEGSENAASYIIWGEAAEFCRRISRRVDMTVYLPTEAQWEYACRAGGENRFCFGSDESNLRTYAWYHKNASDTGERYAHRVARKKPNAWGLYDMHGNVLEWCADYFDEQYYASSENTLDPTGPTFRYSRTVRGGCFFMDARSCTSAWRFGYYRERPAASVGFRVALSAVRPTVARLGSRPSRQAGKAEEAKESPGPRNRPTGRSPVGARLSLDTRRAKRRQRELAEGMGTGIQEVLGLGKGVSMKLALYPLGSSPWARRRAT